MAKITEIYLPGGRNVYWLPKKGRLLSFDRYISLWNYPDLQPVFRVRPVPGIKSMLQPNADESSVFVQYGDCSFAKISLEDGGLEQTIKRSGGKVETDFVRASICRFLPTI